MDSSTRALLQTVTQYWKGFDLDSKRVMLDAQGVSMQEQKEHSVKSRKTLAEHTKRFRKLADADKVAAIPSLLKAYQEEIDTLTKRAKYSDNAFFALYKVLYEAPDPVPALDAALLLDSSIPAAVPSTSSSDKVASTDLVAKLRRELASYEAEFASLKNQDITIRNLEAKLAAMEDNMERQVEIKVQARCRDVENTLRAREADLALYQQQADRTVMQAREARDDALAQLDLMRSELLHVKQQADHVLATQSSETQSLLNDLNRCHGIELENQRLRDQLRSLSSSDFAASQSFQHHSAAVPSMQLELEIAQKEAALAQTRRDVERLQEALTGQTNLWKAEVAALQAQVDELSQRPTVEAYEAAVALQAKPTVHNQSSSSRYAQQSHQQQVAGLAAAELPSIDNLKVIEELQTQVTSQRQTYEATVRQLTTQLDAANGTVQRQAGVISQLEATLDKAATDPAGSSILGDVLGEEVFSNGDKESKLLSIMRQQRDRLKEKLKDVEADLHATGAAKQAMATRLRQLEVENVDLVQKMRYVASAAKPTTDLETGGTKYSTLYEERMNPFDQFKQMESAARVAQLNPLDKILLVSARLILSHPFTRMGLLVYLFVLHSLVVGTLTMSMHLCNVSNHT
ncbi:hypothetical protein H310_07756 [Aphanomyces invadans]|uniref:Protein CASP n=1 Tax=Aphanomyces invadans TaxID=157072 RepID=A0A024U244_9STRA|nr:hypothetical protein H310_07756 [Aphanomyces invadans]ETV99692.1 hypothetical protein H310_07756 [Aphanomyces invadans]|eukprot:XP_008871468.1 hypothetical protein H310_07756 [Aphanomyces invadans]